MIVIAELGSNPAPDWFALDAYCYAAKRSGATHVKIQLFQPSAFPESEQESKRAVMFPRDMLVPFVDSAHHYNLKAGASVFDAEAVELAAEHCDFLKIAAREQTNWTLRAQVVDTGMPFFSSRDDFPDYRDLHIWELLGRSISMFTIPCYPTRVLPAIWKLRQWRKVVETGMNRLPSWGWSSHTRSIWDCVLAARWGASVIEKHMCLGDGRDEPEKDWSLNPKEFAKMTKAMV